MPLWTGFLDNSGAPCLEISIGGPLPNSSQRFHAVIDTGFSGFLSMPLVKAFPLGLLLYGTTNVILADGSTSFKLTAKAEVIIGQESQIGLVILEPASNDILLGMDFLSSFKRVLLVHPTKPIISLVEEAVVDAALNPPTANQPDSSEEVNSEQENSNPNPATSE
jgi:clan AA aspartic protease